MFFFCLVCRGERKFKMKKVITRCFVFLFFWFGSLGIKAIIRELETNFKSNQNHTYDDKFRLNLQGSVGGLIHLIQETDALKHKGMRLTILRFMSRRANDFMADVAQM